MVGNVSCLFGVLMIQNNWESVIEYDYKWEMIREIICPFSIYPIKG